MSTTPSTVFHIHGDCHALQCGNGNTIIEKSNNMSVIYRLRSELNDLNSKQERHDRETKDLEERVADLEAFKKIVEVMTNTNTNNICCKKDTSDDITLKTVGEYRHDEVGTITVSKNVSVNDIKKLIEEKENVKIGHIVIESYKDGSWTYIYKRHNINKNNYSLQQLGVEDQDWVYYYA